jgi:hypothetical protein
MVARCALGLLLGVLSILGFRHAKRTVTHAAPVGADTDNSRLPVGASV